MSAEYIQFLNDNTRPLLPNVTFTAQEWIQITGEFNQNLYTALITGLILGAAIGIVAIKLGEWWNNRGSS